MLEITYDGPIARVQLHRPEVLNALSRSLMEELIAVCAKMNQNSELKVVVFSGSGRAFSSGVDLADFTQGGGDSHERADFGRVFAEAIESVEAVTIAQIHGFCIGGAVVLASACDLRIAADDVVFSVPELQLGIPLTWGGIPRLVRAIGPAATKDLVLSCRQFGSAEALRLGLLNRVVAPDRLDDEVEELAQTIAARSRLTILSTLKSVDAIANAACDVAGATEDAAGMVVALHDEESRAVAARYLSSLGFDA